jgi:undecaprenyl-phosphate galactose phosphotransferase
MYYPFFKRAFDILFSLGVLIVGSPIFLLIALLIKLSSKGPILYKSERIGKKAKTIFCLKFRTMHVDADERLAELLEKNASLKQEWALYQKLKTDPRIHRFGKFLRKSSLDELPQFFNVLQGDLSIVGPRPFYKEQLHHYLGEKAEKFLSVKPGITGIWQVSGRNLLTFNERLILEERYIDHPSFSLDLFILLKTIPMIFFPKGAY